MTPLIKFIIIVGIGGFLFWLFYVVAIEQMKNYKECFTFDGHPCIEEPNKTLEDQLRKS